MKEYVIYNINFPDVPLRTFRTWEEANKRVLLLANRAGYPVQDFIIKEVEAKDVFYDERNDRYITLLSRNDAKVWSAQVEEMGEAGAYDMMSIALFTEQELRHFTRR